MRKTFSIVTTAGAALLAGNLAMMPVAVAGDSLPTDKECKKLDKADAATKGWCTMINRKKGNCLACHGAGVGGAPVPGDADAWAERVAQGMDVLKDHAINGYQGSVGYMPAKGGRVDLSDEEVASAVEYMVSESQ